MSENCRKSAKTTEASNLRAAFFAPGIWIWLRRQVRKMPAFFALVGRSPQISTIWCENCRHFSHRLRSLYQVRKMPAVFAPMGQSPQICTVCQCINQFNQFICVSFFLFLFYFILFQSHLKNFRYLKPKFCLQTNKQTNKYTILFIQLLHN